MADWTAQNATGCHRGANLTLKLRGKDSKNKFCLHSVGPSSQAADGISEKPVLEPRIQLDDRAQLSPEWLSCGPADLDDVLSVKQMPEVSKLLTGNPAARHSQQKGRESGVRGRLHWRQSVHCEVHCQSFVLSIKSNFDATH